jgi:hypothetical protein
LADLFDQKKENDQMIPSNTRGSKQTPKRRSMPKDLAERFLELQQLREKIYELEKRANDHQQCTRSTPDGRSK